MLTPWKESYDQPRQHIKKQRHYFANKGPSSQGYGFSSGRVWMWELDYKESWAPKNWCFWTVVLKTLESPLDCKEIQPIHPKGDQLWVFIGRTDVEAETPILWPPDAKSGHIGKDPDAGKAWGHEEKGTTEDEMVGWHHWLDGNGFGWPPGVGDGQGGLRAVVHGVPRSRTRLSDWTELNFCITCQSCSTGSSSFTYGHLPAWSIRNQQPSSLISHPPSTHIPVFFPENLLEPIIHPWSHPLFYPFQSSFSFQPPLWKQSSQ